MKAYQSSGAAALARRFTLGYIAVVFLVAVWSAPWPRFMSTALAADQSTPDAALQNMVDGVAKGEPVKFWRALPQSYQNDVKKAVAQFASGMDDEVYAEVFSLLRKFVLLLKTRQKQLIDSPSLVNLNLAGTEKTWDPLVGMLDALLSDDIATVEKLKKLDIDNRLATAGSKFMKNLSEVSANSPGDPFNTQVRALFKDVKIRTVSSNDKTAMVEVTVRGQQSVIEMIKVDGKWVPDSLVESWKPLASVLDRTSKAMPGRINKIKPQLLMMIGFFDKGLDRMLAAKTDAEFDQAIAYTFSPIRIARQGAQRLQSSTQMRGIHQMFVVYAQSNKGWFPDRGPEGKVRFAQNEQAEVFDLLLQDDFFTHEYIMHPLAGFSSTYDHKQDKTRRLEWISRYSGYVIVPGRKETLRTTEIALFEKLQFSDGKTLQICWNDNHVSQEPLAKARELIKQQTGKSLDDWCPLTKEQAQRLAHRAKGGDVAPNAAQVFQALILLAGALQPEAAEQAEGVMRQMRSLTQIQRIHQRFVEFAQENMNWYPDRTKTGEPRFKKDWQAQTLNLLLEAKSFTPEYVIHPSERGKFLNDDVMAWEKPKRITWIKKNCPYVFVPGHRETLKTDELFMFEKIQYANDGMLGICWQDNHVQRVPLDKARQIIEQQTGKTLEQWSGVKPRS